MGDLLYTRRANKGFRKCRKRCCCCGEYGCGCCGKVARALLVAVCGLVSGVVVACACFAPSYLSVMGESTLFPVTKADAVNMLYADNGDELSEMIAYGLLFIGYVGQWASVLVLMVMMMVLWLCIFRW